jgi:hypothetical protein
MDFSPLPWGEGGESSEPGEGFLHPEPRNFGIRVQFVFRGGSLGPLYARSFRATSPEMSVSRKSRP